MSSAWAGIGWFALLLLGNAFFVGAEFAVMSARRAQIEPRAEAGSRPAKITIKAMEKVSLMLATTQLGVTICSLLILLIVEPSVHELLQPLLGSFSEQSAGTIAFVVTLVLVSFLHVVFGEMVPKNISFSIPERAALILVPVLYGFAQLVRPLVIFLNACANLFVRIFGVKVRDDEMDKPMPTKRIRTLISLPNQMELEDALASMKRVGAHMAKSFDASGKVLGVLFLEDILEELVGEVTDATQK